MKYSVGLGSKTSQVVGNNPTRDTSIYAVRVTRVLLDDKTYPDLFKEFGEWESLGLIFYDDIHSPDPLFIKENYAYSLFPNIKNYPLINEIVYLVNLPSLDLTTNSEYTKSYYFSPINLWNNIHHNAIPDNILEDNIPKRYDQINLGEYFKERDDVRGLKPYEGDIIYEGRWGNSIRFSSTQKDKNFWSKYGNNGDPIIIIKNGQPINLSGEPWIPIDEDINKDPSGIYLTSYQKIPIFLSSNSYKSYDISPIESQEYLKPQIILNSDRIIINSKEDSILLSSQKTINLNSNETINLDSKKGFIVDSPKIFLGSKNATEPLVLGNKFKTLLEQILDELIELSTQLSTLSSLPPGVPFAPLNMSATKANFKLNSYKNQLKTLLSKRNTTL